MTTITVSEGCGNAPKKAVLRDLNVAFAENDVEFVLDNVPDDVEWTVVGATEIRGKDGVADELERMMDREASELVIEQVITHGTTGAVDGKLKLDSGETYSFCDMHEFSGHGKNAKIRTMTSYVVEIENGDPVISTSLEGSPRS